MNRTYGFKSDLPDARDFQYKRKLDAKQLPNKVDLRPGCPPIVDQGSLGSCTANAWAGALGYEQLRKGPSPEDFGDDKTFYPISRLFIYYYERVLEGTVRSDAGAQLRSGMKVVVNTGFCREMLWPYKIGKFNYKPSAFAQTEAANHKALGGYRVNLSMLELCTCLAEGYPVVIGISVYDSFESDKVAKTGMVPMPNLKKESMLGGHALLVVGYDDSKRVFVVRNSWGTSWGDKGYCYIPYNYLTNSNLASDFWTLRTKA